MKLFVATPQIDFFATLASTKCTGVSFLVRFALVSLTVNVCDVQVATLLQLLRLSCPVRLLVNKPTLFVAQGADVCLRHPRLNGRAYVTRYCHTGRQPIRLPLSRVSRLSFVPHLQCPSQRHTTLLLTAIPSVSAIQHTRPLPPQSKLTG
ncbi:hypothetical protein BCR44DRAFT_324928 [Catenaria anguillulae PL171]|uniref:Uncharacterized protein n=1 Tax=Catenaria anguillulae PL171 TaxID=765915 RepID=A0A1Y2HFA9_9FUNG|nr:hypothetical protein BCR44DRAFT_324928 [Catenaria anguillulae PL171]